MSPSPLSTPPLSPLILFSHANGFPLGTYSVLLRSLRSRGYTVRGVERFGHDPSYPVGQNWTTLVDQLVDFGQPLARDHAGPVYLVGHSLGGYLSAMAAALHPDLGGRPLAGVVLLDAPLLSGWKARFMQVVKATGWVEKFSPGQVSKKRRQSWASADEALAHFASKRAFAAWEPQVLRDYIEHGTRDEAGPQGTRRVLAFDRQVETDIYNTLPHHLDRLLRRHPMRCPMGYIGGEQSYEMQQVGLGLTLRTLGPGHGERLRMLPGGHLFPMERPLDTAAALAETLAALKPPTS